MQIENYRDKSVDERELSSVCETLWSDHIRTDLVFSKKLQLCLICLAFHYPSPDADHPVDQVVAVQRFFSDNNITSLGRLVEFMRDIISKATAGSGNLSKDQKPRMPSFSTKHQPLTGSQLFISDHNLNLLRLRDQAVDLQSQLSANEEVVSVLRDELQRLRKENEEVMVELFRHREMQGQKTKVVLRLLNQIISCISGCQCTCDCSPADIK